MRPIIFKSTLWLMGLYALISIGIFWIYGVKNVNDSARYLNYAHHLHTQFYVDAHNIWYFGYVLFIFLIQQFSDNELFIILMQYFLGAWAVIALYRASWLLHQNQEAAWLTALGYILFIDMMAWNSYILCESFYCSMMCFSLYGLVWIYRSQRIYFWQYALVGMTLLWTIFTKPSSVALTGACLFSLLFWFYKYLIHNKLKNIFSIFFGIGFLILINKMLTTFRLIEVYELGEIIFATARMPYRPVFEWLMLKAPENIYIPPKNYTPIYRLLSFMVHNPIFFSKLFFSKLFYFVVHIRPYWSWKHNFFSILVLFPTYFYVFRVFFRQTLSIHVRSFAFIFLSLQALIVSLTVVDWDGRFLMPVMPVLFLLIGDEIRKTNQITYLFFGKNSK